MIQSIDDFTRRKRAEKHSISGLNNKMNREHQTLTHQTWIISLSGLTLTPSVFTKSSETVFGFTLIWKFDATNTRTALHMLTRQCEEAARISLIIRLAAAIIGKPSG